MNISTAIESNLLSMLPKRAYGSLFRVEVRGAASSLVCRQWILGSAQHFVAVVGKEAKYAQDWILRHVGGVYRGGDTTPDSGREGGSPLCSHRDQITRFSAIFDLRAVTSAGDRRDPASCANLIARFSELNRSEPFGFSEKFLIQKGGLRNADE